MARRRKAQLELPTVGADAAVGTQVTSDATAVGPVNTAPTAWRVARTAQVSLFGQLTTVHEGDVVSAAGYGSLGLRRLGEQVELIPVE